MKPKRDYSDLFGYFGIQLDKNVHVTGLLIRMQPYPKPQLVKLLK